jgi:hypothetical protein
MSSPHDLPVVFDLQGVFPDQVVRQFVDGGRDGGGAAFDHRLAPAGDAIISVDLEEEPARRDGVGGKPGNLHG